MNEAITAPLEQAQKALKSSMVGFLNTSESKVPAANWEQANIVLGKIATAAVGGDKVSFENGLKTFANMAGKPPFNEHTELFALGDEVAAAARQYWNLKYPN